MEAFKEIKESLKKKGGNEKTFQMTLSEHEFIMTWTLNKLCNYRCDYCFLTDEFLSNEHPETGKYSHEYIADCFDRSAKNWLIILSGGEPFLYPDFVGLAETLTKNHHIVINSNLSMKSAFDFAERVNPEKVIFLNASMHMTELVKRKDGVGKYVEKFLYLQDKGFNIYLTYVAYPTLLNQIEKDVSFFKQQGIKKISVKYFHGMFDSKPYPLSYSMEEKEMISRNALNPVEADEYQEKPFFYGRQCAAGQKFFAMDMAGNLKRCTTLQKQYGNFFTGKFKFDKSLKPCPVPECLCAYEGFLLTNNKSSSAFSLWKEKQWEHYYAKKSE